MGALLTNKVKPQQTNVVSDDILTKFYEANLSSTTWIYPQTFSENYGSIRKSYQYIMTKCKLVEAFESREDYLTISFRELLKFP